MLHISVSYMSCNQRIDLLVKYLCEKVKNFCKRILKAENGTGKLFFGSVILRPRLQHGTGNFRYREILGLDVRS